MNNDTVTAQSGITQIQCPGCRNKMWNESCSQCGGTGWIPAPKVPPYQITINPMDLTLSLRLDRLEQKLDRLLAALEDTS